MVDIVKFSDLSIPLKAGIYTRPEHPHKLRLTQEDVEAIQRCGADTLLTLRKGVIGPWTVLMAQPPS